MTNKQITAHEVRIDNAYYGAFELGEIVHTTDQAVLVRGIHKIDDGTYEIYSEHWIPRRFIQVGKEHKMWLCWIRVDEFREDKKIVVDKNPEIKEIEELQKKLLRGA